MPDRFFDRAVVGGGILGLAVAHEILRRRPALSLALLEKERDVARHQTGHNSGVIHSGVYYRPGSLKAKLCLEGREKLLRFCKELGIPYRISGKLIVAVEEREVPALAKIYEHGKANGVDGLAMIGPEGLREKEPHVRGLQAIHVPSAGVVDFGAVAAALGEEVRRLGGEILLGHEVNGVDARSNATVLETTGGTLGARKAVFCAGLQSDRVAGLSEDLNDLRIVPFRGDYYFLRPEARHLTRSIVNPVPDSRFPFLGVHFTRRIDDEVLAGPNAVLALAREGYGRFCFRPLDGVSTFSWPGFWRLALRHWRTGTAELWRDYVKTAYLRRLQRFVPEIRLEDLLPGPCGIRAQAVRRDGSLVDDFVIRQRGDLTHVLNAPSPAATSSLAIAREIVDRVEGPSSVGK